MANTRRGSIQAFSYRIVETGKLKKLHEGTACITADTTKIDKVTICNTATCAQLITVAFMNPDQDEATGLLATDKGVYIVRNVNVPVGATLILDKYYFDVIKNAYGTSDACLENDWVLGVRSDNPAGVECAINAGNPSFDVLITK
tara:strand:- start:376 stop:810 length:435 start_codon:yes stop_codon:yes gene_type:complete